MEPQPFTPYALEIDGNTYTVLDPSEPTAHRIQLPTGEVTACPCIESADTLTVEALAEWIANPPPLPVSVVALTPLTILSRLTPEEEAALSGSTDLLVCVVRNRLVAASEVRSDDPRTAEGAAVLVSKGIITEARAGEIFPL
jgi:hypothetical protein